MDAGPSDGHSERLIFPYKTKAFKTAVLAGMEYDMYV